MLLSEKLKQDSDSGDFGKAFEGYSERVKILEDALFAISEYGHKNSGMGFTCANMAAKALLDYGV